MEVSKATLQEAIDTGASTFTELVDKTQACTGCGSCSIYLHEMLGEKVEWTAVTVRKSCFIAEDVKSYQLICKDKSYQFPPHQPGHYILVKAKIKGKWVSRPYAISSMRSESSYREITVRRKPKGELTEWLFNQKSPIELFISNPQGDKFFDIEDKTRPVVCFTGGVGVTPVISACRSIIKERKGYVNFHLDYSTVGHANFSKQATAEFKRFIKQNKKFSFTYRDTTVEGKITSKEVREIAVKAHPKTLYYISGPAGYELHIQKCLLQAGVNNQHIYPLSSKHLTETPAENKTEKSSSKQAKFKPYFYIGCFLFLSFLIQDFFNLKIPALETLQSLEYYKRWTGYSLLAYFAFQWSYPLIRLARENKHFIVYQKIHKLSGAFAPAVFYVHSTQFGYAYLSVLSIIYLVNFLLPLCNKDNFQTLFENQLIYKTWLGTHIFLSITVTSLMFYHIYNAFSYS